jgi:hypothetical protein
VGVWGGGGRYCGRSEQGGRLEDLVVDGDHADDKSVPMRASVEAEA